MSFVGNPGADTGVTGEPLLEQRIREGKAVLLKAAAGDAKLPATAQPIVAALRALIEATEADDRVYPRMRPVR